MGHLEYKAKVRRGLGWGAAKSGEFVDAPGERRTLGAWCDFQLHGFDAADRVLFSDGKRCSIRATGGEPDDPFPSGKVRNNQLGNRFLAARRSLLTSAKRMMVDLRQVSDPECRAVLERSGVKMSAVNRLLRSSPLVSHEM